MKKIQLYKNGCKRDFKMEKFKIFVIFLVTIALAHAHPHEYHSFSQYSTGMEDSGCSNFDTDAVDLAFPNFSVKSQIDMLPCQDGNEKCELNAKEEETDYFNQFGGVSPSRAR